MMLKRKARSMPYTWPYYGVLGAMVEIGNKVHLLCAIGFMVPIKRHG